MKRLLVFNVCLVLCLAFGTTVLAAQTEITLIPDDKTPDVWAFTTTDTVGGSTRNITYENGGYVYEDSEGKKVSVTFKIYAHSPNSPLEPNEVKKLDEIENMTDDEFAELCFLVGEAIVPDSGGNILCTPRRSDSVKVYDALYIPVQYLVQDEETKSSMDAARNAYAATQTPTPSPNPSQPQTQPTDKLPTATVAPKSVDEPMLDEYNFDKLIQEIKRLAPKKGKDSRYIELEYKITDGVITSVSLNEVKMDIKATTVLFILICIVAVNLLLGSAMLIKHIRSKR